MSKKYQTYWMHGSTRIDDYEEMVRLVDAGKLVSEVSAESQRLRAENIAQAKQKPFEGLPTIDASQFSPIWLIDGTRYDDYETVRNLVLAGSIAVEISPQTQAEEATRRVRIEKAERDREEAALNEATGRRVMNSPQGKQAEAVRIAAANPGGLVTTGRSFGISELDFYGPASTSRLK